MESDNFCNGCRDGWCNSYRDENYKDCSDERSDGHHNHCSCIRCNISYEFFHNNNRITNRIVDLVANDMSAMEVLAMAHLMTGEHFF